MQKAAILLVGLFMVSFVTDCYSAPNRFFLPEFAEYDYPIGEEQRTDMWQLLEGVRENGKDWPTASSVKMSDPSKTDGDIGALKRGASEAMRHLEHASSKVADALKKAWKNLKSGKRNDADIVRANLEDDMEDAKTYLRKADAKMRHTLELAGNKPHRGSDFNAALASAAEKLSMPYSPDSRHSVGDERPQKGITRNMLHRAKKRWPVYDSYEVEEYGAEERGNCDCHKPDNNSSQNKTGGNGDDEEHDTIEYEGVDYRHDDGDEDMYYIGNERHMKSSPGKMKKNDYEVYDDEVDAFKRHSKSRKKSQSTDEPKLLNMTTDDNRPLSRTFWERSTDDDASSKNSPAVTKAVEDGMNTLFRFFNGKKRNGAEQWLDFTRHDPEHNHVHRPISPSRTRSSHRSEEDEHDKGDMLLLDPFNRLSLARTKLVRSMDSLNEIISYLAMDQKT